MADYVSPEMIRAARRANLYDYLLQRHCNDFETDRDSIRFRSNHSICIKRGYSGYKDWATDETGNGIDFLTNYMGYTFQKAVTALAGNTDLPSKQRSDPSPPTVTVAETTTRPYIIPPPLSGSYRQLYAYLTKMRSIPANAVKALIDAKLLYQAATYGNMVFLSADRFFYEIRGSNSYKSFHQVGFDPDHPESYWSFRSTVITGPPTSYVCEGAIDAISLSLIHQASKISTNAIYCSIGGIANQQRIDCIKQTMASLGGSTYIAVDNDTAGQHCRDANPDCLAIIPTAKDWNEDWCNYVRRTGGP